MLSNLLLGTELVESGMELEPKILIPVPGLLTLAKLLSLAQFLTHQGGGTLGHHLQPWF